MTDGRSLSLTSVTTAVTPSERIGVQLPIIPMACIRRGRQDRRLLKCRLAHAAPAIASRFGERYIARWAEDPVATGEMRRSVGRAEHHWER